MIDHVFSPHFIQLLKNHHTSTTIDTIDHDLVELVVAGLTLLENRHILWVIGENENFAEKEARLNLWLQWLTPPHTAIPPITFYLKPFADPYINNPGDLRATGHKARLIAHLLANRPLVVLTTLSALNLQIEDQSTHPDFFLHVQKDQEISRQDLIERLTAMGYQNRHIVEDPGDISWRGSIVDVFPIDHDKPVRIEIEGDTLVSLRTFAPDSQKSLQRIQNIIFPISRFFLDYPTITDYFNHKEKKMRPLTDILKDFRLVFSDKRKIIDEFDKLMANYQQIFEVSRTHTQNLLPPADLFHNNLATFPCLSLDETWDNISNPTELVKHHRSLNESNLEDIHHILSRQKKEKLRLFICSPGKQANPRWHDHFISFVHIPAVIPFSFENQVTGCLFLAEKNFQFVDKIERVNALKTDTMIKDIQTGDLVVHKKHGIGTFVGFQRLEFEGHISEFLKIEYLNREYLYVPVYEIDVLNKYIAFEGHKPKIDRLGGSSWATKQKKARNSMILFARELLELYAMRKAIKGYSYTRDYELEEKLGEGFRYVETEDQKKAIRDVLADLEADFPMDRLICGDVSFGKTEVALRAALRVAANGKQVAVLCPTTILAFQHYATFTQRFKSLPITIAMLSRLVTTTEKKKIIKNLSEGKIDIVIGTHSLIAREIPFKRLGLFIIDEEQRFGVFQKEKLKKNREEIDVLSMSATPIPRTLSFALAGLQDISTIQTPPLGRLAIKNYVGYYSKEIIISAILHEMERDGLVFIVYNSIERIYTFKDELDHWLPQVQSVVIHAQMDTHDIESHLMDFIGREYRVLISTTIIENGIDIQDVNTLVVLDADRFGLTQLYQLRGRIGRGNRQAYAYFLVRTMSLPEKARARLEAIRDFAELGSGYQLAEFDLKLRGAGSLLGNRQHGHIEALGFDYYHQLLARTIKELKGELEKQKESQIDIHFSYSIDSDYIRSSSERIMIYRRILEADAFSQVEELRTELEDRYGRIPDSIEKIFFAGVIRVLAKKWQLDHVEVYLDRIIIQFPGGIPSPLDNPKRLPDFIRSEPINTRSCIFHLLDYKKFSREISRFFLEHPIK